MPPLFFLFKLYIKFPFDMSLNSISILSILFFYDKISFFAEFLEVFICFFCYILLLFSNLFLNLFFASFNFKNLYFLIAQFFQFRSHHSLLVYLKIICLNFH